jgi:hypothetical protein
VACRSVVLRENRRSADSLGESTISSKLMAARAGLYLAALLHPIHDIVLCHRLGTSLGPAEE